MKKPEKMKNMWSVRQGNHLYVYHNGKLIYKRWLAKDGKTKTQPSRIFNDNGWPSVEVI